MEDALRAKLIARYIETYNNFDVEGMAALLSARVCFENYSAGERSHATHGIDEFIALANSSKALFAEREQRITDLRFETTSVLATVEFRGRLAANMAAGTAAGTVVEMAGTSRFFFEDGRISKVIDDA
jgi:CHASE1-domain containing sensor protein